MTKRANGDGDIWPRRNAKGEITSYCGAYYGPDGKRRYVSGKTKEDARRNLRRARGDVEGGLVFAAGNLTVGEYLDRWLKDSVKDTVKATSFERYEQMVRIHIGPALGRVKLKALTPAHVRGLYREKLDAGLSARTVRYVHTTLHKSLKQAVMDGLIFRNATEAVKPPQIARVEMRPLTPEQAKRLLETARRDRLEALYVLAVHTGMRQGEMLSLRWDDVDLDSGVLRVRGTKTARSRRTVKLTQTALESLTSHLARQLEEIDRAGDSWRENGLVFATENGAPLKRHSVSRHRFKPLLKRAGLPEIRFHDLRHTCATLLLTRNVNPKIVSEMLGHATIAITLDTYSHVLPNMRDQAAKAMEVALS